MFHYFNGEDRRMYDRRTPSPVADLEEAPLQEGKTLRSARRGFERTKPVGVAKPSIRASGCLVLGNEKDAEDDGYATDRMETDDRKHTRLTGARRHPESVMLPFRFDPLRPLTTAIYLEDQKILRERILEPQVPPPVEPLISWPTPGVAKDDRKWRKKAQPPPVDPPPLEGQRPILHAAPPQTSLPDRPSRAIHGAGSHASRSHRNAELVGRSLMEAEQQVSGAFDALRETRQDVAEEVAIDSKAPKEVKKVFRVDLTLSQCDQWSHFTFSYDERPIETGLIARISRVLTPIGFETIQRHVYTFGKVGDVGNTQDLRGMMAQQTGPIGSEYFPVVVQIQHKMISRRWGVETCVHIKEDFAYISAALFHHVQSCYQLCPSDETQQNRIEQTARQFWWLNLSPGQAGIHLKTVQIAMAYYRFLKQQPVAHFHYAQGVGLSSVMDTATGKSHSQALDAPKMARVLHYALSLIPTSALLYNVHWAVVSLEQVFPTLIHIIRAPWLAPYLSEWLRAPLNVINNCFESLETLLMSGFLKICSLFPTPLMYLLKRGLQGPTTLSNERINCEKFMRDCKLVMLPTVCAIPVFLHLLKMSLIHLLSMLVLFTRGSTNLKLWSVLCSSLWKASFIVVLNLLSMLPYLIVLGTLRSICKLLGQPIWPLITPHSNHISMQSYCELANSSSIGIWCEIVERLYPLKHTTRRWFPVLIAVNSAVCLLRYQHPGCPEKCQLPWATVLQTSWYFYLLCKNLVSRVRRAL